MPRHGYTKLFQNMLNHKNIKILLNTDYREIVGDIKFNKMIYTGPIDAFFDYTHGELPYRSLRFEFSTENQPHYQDVGTVNYPNDYAFTRTTEQKILTGQSGPKTTLITEYPQAHIVGENEPYYPIPREQNRSIFNTYSRELEKLNGTVLMAGRLADYQYYNMDQVVARALKIFAEGIAP